MEWKGDRAAHVVAFARRLADNAAGPAKIAVAVAPRLLARLTPLPEGENRPPPPLGEGVWKDTYVDLNALAGGEWRGLFTGRSMRPQYGRLPLADVLADFPVALLVNTSE